MSRLLLVTIAERGHINPLVGVAQHLCAMGHELTVCAAVDLADAFASAGVHARAVVIPGPPAADDGFVTRGRRFVERLHDPAWLHAWIERLLLDPVASQAEAIYGALRETRADAVVADPMVYGAAMAAHRAGVPWAGVSSSLNPVTPDDWRVPLSDSVRRLSARRAQLFADHGMHDVRFKICDALSPWLNTVFTTEAYVPRARAFNAVSHYVGPSLPMGLRGDEREFPFERLDPARPAVLFSLGSQVYWHPNLFLTAAVAARAEGAQLIVAAHELLDDEDFVRALPPEVIAVRYVPQLSVLKRVRAMISHGGANSVMEALAHGVPLCLVPVCNDQFLQARLLHEAGVGSVLEPERFTVEACRRVVREMLSGEANARAAAVHASYKTRDGAREAASLIDTMTRTRAPLMPRAEGDG